MDLWTLTRITWLRDGEAQQHIGVHRACTRFIKESANAVHRSLNSQIIWLLETGLAARDKRDV